MGGLNSGRNRLNGCLSSLFGLFFPNDHMVTPSNDFFAAAFFILKPFFFLRRSAPSPFRFYSGRKKKTMQPDQCRPFIELHHRPVHGSETGRPGQVEKKSHQIKSNRRNVRNSLKNKNCQTFYASFLIGGEDESAGKGCGADWP